MVGQWQLFRVFFWRRFQLDATQGTGLFWYVADASLYVAVHILVFSRVAAMKQEHLPDYLPPIVAHGAYVCCGILPWKSLANAGSAGTRTFRANGTFLRKTAVRPAFFALLDAAHQMVQFCTVLGLMFLLLVGLGYRPGIALLQLPLVLMAHFGLLIAVSLGCASIGTFMPGMAAVWGMLARIMLWTTPIVYPRALLPEPLAAVLRWTPLWQLVDAYRDVIARNHLMSAAQWTCLATVVTVCLLAAWAVYERLEQDVRDFA